MDKTTREKAMRLSSALLGEDRKPTKALLKLLESLSIRHAGTLKIIVDETQKAWLRPAGQEKWEYTTTFPSSYEKWAPHFEELRLI